MIQSRTQRNLLLSFRDANDYMHRTGFFFWFHIYFDRRSILSVCALFITFHLFRIINIPFQVCGYPLKRYPLQKHKYHFCFADKCFKDSKDVGTWSANLLMPPVGKNTSLILRTYLQQRRRL